MTTIITRRGTIVPGTTPAVGVAPSYASAATSAAMSAAMTAGPTGLDPYRPWSSAVLDGLLYVANGRDQPKRWDGASSFYNLGAAAATSFSLADSASGSTFPSGTVVRYRLVFRNSTVAKETCPQLASSDGFFADGAIGVSHTMTGTKDIDITWTDPGGEFDQVAIYRAPAGSDSYFLVATVTASTATYTDSTADSALDQTTDNLHVLRERTTLPPKFIGLAEHLNRLWGFEDRSTKLRYSQVADPLGELTQEDFPSLNFIHVAPEDGMGYLTAAHAHFDSFYVWKDRAAYEITGSSEATFGVRRMYADRGACNSRCVVETDGGYLAALDDQGLYLWGPGAQPIVAGAVPGDSEARIQPIWNRMNLAARDLFHVIHDRRNRVLHVWVALDHEPIPNVRVVYDYASNIFLSIDVAAWSTAGGEWVDALDTTHLMHGGDLGFVWEDGLGASEGVTTGDLTAAVTSGSALLVTCSGASFDTTIEGPLGAPYQRGTAGSDAVDTNRAAAVTSTAITPYYYSSSTPTSAETVYVGSIPAVARTGKFSFGTAEKKHIRMMELSFNSGFSGTLRVGTAQDDGSYTTKKNVDMSSDVRSIVSCDDRAWTWALELAQNAADAGFEVRGARVLVKTMADRKA
ncbi:MAG: hypothetical protein ACE5FA_04085 [Dehalococcoidia bacterium]